MSNKDTPLSPKEIKHINKLCGQRQEGKPTECLSVMNGVHLSHLQEQVKYAKLIRQLSAKLQEARLKLKVMGKVKRSSSCVSVSDQSSVNPPPPETRDNASCAVNKVPLNREQRSSRPSSSQSFLSLPDLLHNFKELEEENHELRAALQLQWLELNEVQSKYKRLKDGRQAGQRKAGEVTDEEQEEGGKGTYDSRKITVLGH